MRRIGPCTPETSCSGFTPIQISHLRMQNPQNTGTQDRGSRPASGLSHEWFVEDRSPHLLGYRLYSTVCGIPRRGAALRAAGLRPLRVAGLRPGPHPHGPSGRPQRRRLRRPARGLRPPCKGLRPRMSPSSPSLGCQLRKLVALRAGSAWNGQCLVLRSSCGGRGFAPGRQGSSMRSAQSQLVVETRCASSEGNLRATSTRHESFGSSNSQRSAARTDEVRLPGRSPRPLKEGHPYEAPLRSSEDNGPTTTRPTERKRPGGSRAKDHAKPPQSTTRRNTKRPS